MNLESDGDIKDWFCNSYNTDKNQLICNGRAVQTFGDKSFFFKRNKNSVADYTSFLQEINRKDSETEIKILSEKYYPKNFRFYNSAIATKKKIFFLHIPKTAGSSLNQMLSEHFKKKKTKLHIESDRKNNYNAVNPQKLDFISGHIRLHDVINQFSLNNFLRVTILRNPYDQLISHINWLRFIGTNPDGKFFKAHSKPIQELSLQTKQYNFEETDEVERFVKEMPPLGHRLFNNCQTRFLLNKKNPEAISGESAKEAIETLHYFDIIGTVEQLDLFMQKVYQKMDWGKPKKILKTNELNNKYKLQRDSDDLKKVLAPLLTEDQVLYDHIKSQNLS